MVGELKGHGVESDPELLQSFVETLPKLKQATEQLLESKELSDGFPQVIGAGVSMLESGMLDKEVIATLGYLGRAGVQTYHEVNEQPVEPVGGLFSLLKASRDPEVRKTIGFGLAMAKAFAKHLP